MIISKTPLRISFAGGGTDLPAFYRRDFGAVLSSTIDKYVYVIIKERFDDLIYINWSKKEIVHSPDEIEHDLVREAIKKAGIRRGVEITTLADIPSEGSGLGSSSSLTVGLLNAFYAFTGIQASTEQLAREASEIEIETIGKPIGKQDHYAAAFGGMNELIFRKEGSVEVHPLSMSNELFRDFGSNLLLIYTDITRKADSILKKQRAQTDKLYEPLIKMRDQVGEIKRIIDKHELDSMGPLLDRGWRLKKSLVNSITNSQIDDMYRTALNNGASGGKICGAGAGGFLLLYVPLQHQQAVKKALKDYRELPFMLERYGSRIVFNQRIDYWK